MDISSALNNPLYNPTVHDSSMNKIRQVIGNIDKDNKQDFQDKINKANEIMSSQETHLKFEIHEKTHDVMIKIIQNETGEVLKEIPPEKLIDMIAKICEIAGLFIDKKI